MGVVALYGVDNFAKREAETFVPDARLTITGPRGDLFGAVRMPSKAWFPHQEFELVTQFVIRNIHTVADFIEAFSAVWQAVVDAGGGTVLTECLTEDGSLFACGHACF